MITVFLIAILFGVVVIFIQEKTKFLGKSVTPSLLASIAGIFVALYFNNHCLIYLIPSDSKIEKKESLQKIGEEGGENIFIATSESLSFAENKIKINFLKEGDKEVSEEDVDKNNIIFTQNNEGASIISICPTRKGFLKFFVIYPFKHKYCVPKSGIKEGKIISSSLFEFLPDK